MTVSAKGGISETKGATGGISQMKEATGFKRSSPGVKVETDREDRGDMTPRSAQATPTSSNLNSMKRDGGKQAKITKEQLSNMQLKLIAVESNMTSKQNERAESSRKISKLKRSLGIEMTKRSALDVDREKMAREAIELKIAIQNGILAIGQK